MVTVSVSPSTLKNRIDLRASPIALDTVDSAVRSHRPEGRDALVGLGLLALLTREYPDHSLLRREDEVTVRPLALNPHFRFEG